MPPRSGEPALPRTGGWRAIVRAEVAYAIPAAAMALSPARSEAPEAPTFCSRATTSRCSVGRDGESFRGDEGQSSKTAIEATEPRLVRARPRTRVTFRRALVVPPEELPAMFRPIARPMTAPWLREVPHRSLPPPNAAGGRLARRFDSYALDTRRGKPRSAEGRSRRPPFGSFEGDPRNAARGDEGRRNVTLVRGRALTRRAGERGGATPVLRRQPRARNARIHWPAGPS